MVESHTWPIAVCTHALQAMTNKCGINRSLSPASLDRCIPPSPHWITTIEKRKGERERRKRRETGGIPLMERRRMGKRKKERARNEKKREGGRDDFPPPPSFLFRRLSNFILFLLSQHKSFIRIKEGGERKENISWCKSSEISSIESTTPNIVEGDLEINKSLPTIFAPAR